MAYLIPETAMRLQAVAFVDGAELARIGRGEIIRAAAENMAEQALRKLLDDRIRTEGNYMGYPGQTLRLDVYVLEPAELHTMLAEARMQGQRDAEHWSRHPVFIPSQGEHR